MTTGASSPCSLTFGPRWADPLGRVYADKASEAWQCRAYVPMRASTARIKRRWMESGRRW